MESDRSRASLSAQYAIAKYSTTAYMPRITSREPRFLSTREGVLQGCESLFCRGQAVPGLLTHVGPGMADELVVGELAFQPPDIRPRRLEFAFQGAAVGGAGGAHRRRDRQLQTSHHQGPRRRLGQAVGEVDGSQPADRGAAAITVKKLPGGVLGQPGRPQLQPLTLAGSDLLTSIPDASHQPEEGGHGGVTFNVGGAPGLGPIAPAP